MLCRWISRQAGMLGSVASCRASLLPGLLQEAHQEASDAAIQAQQHSPQQQQRSEAEQQASHQPPAAALEALQERSRQALGLNMSSAGCTPCIVAQDLSSEGSTLCFAVRCMCVGSGITAKI